MKRLTITYSSNFQSFYLTESFILFNLDLNYQIIILNDNYRKMKTTSLCDYLYIQPYNNSYLVVRRMSGLRNFIPHMSYKLNIQRLIRLIRNKYSCLFSSKWFLRLPKAGNSCYNIVKTDIGRVAKKKTKFFLFQTCLLNFFLTCWKQYFELFLIY